MKQFIAGCRKQLKTFRHKLHWEDFIIKVVEDGEAYSFCTECGWRSEGIRSPERPLIAKTLEGDRERHALRRPRLVRFKKERA